MLALPLELEIKASLAAVYGQDRLDEMFPRILEIAGAIRQKRPPLLKEEDSSRPSDWYKDEIVYMFYLDQFGVEGEKANTFFELVGMLDYLQDLGATTLYILPFMDSPMGDAGFDVRDPEKVRSDLGGMEAFEIFAQEARKRKLKLKADLILNHFSDQHSWFQAALKGDREMIERFVFRRKAPVYTKYSDPQRGVVVDYEEEGKISSRRLIFPDICEDHYRRVEIEGEDYYFYHTFYPFQLDVNWENPEVLYDMLRVIGSWANRGIDIFRMDAIPYFIKEPGTDGENLPKTHRVIKILSAFLQAVAPRSIMQAEACQWPKDILPYFGRERTLDRNEHPLVRTDEVQVAYNFPYMPSIWASLATGEKRHFWKAFYATPSIPPSAAWSIFLRVHDELTLEMVDLETRKLLYDYLLPRGAEFRKGLGVSGRMFEFLDRDPRRIEQAFALLLSLPGIPTVYFGDEIGAANNWEYAKQAEAERKKEQEVEVLSFFDSRDINRGPIAKKAFEEGRRSEIYRKVKRLIDLRKRYDVLRRGDLVEVPGGENFLAFKRKFDDREFFAIHNLAPQEADYVFLETEPFVLENAALMDLISGEKAVLEGEEGQRHLTLSAFRSVWLTPC